MLLFLFFRIFQFVFNEHFLTLGLKNTHPEKENSGLPPRLQARMGQRRLKQVEARAPGGAGRGGGCPAAHRSPRAILKLPARKAFPKYGLLPASGNHIPPSPSDPRTQSHPLGPLAPTLVTTGSASRVSHRKIPLRPSQRGRVQTEGTAPLEAPHLLGGGQPREGWQRGLTQAPEGRAGHSGGLGGCRAWLRARQAVEGEAPPEPRTATGASCAQVASPHPLGMSSLSSQGQLRLQLYSLGWHGARLASTSWAGHTVPGAWHQELLCVSWCPRSEPQRQPLHSPALESWVLLEPERSSRLSTRPFGPRSLPSCSSFLLSRVTPQQLRPDLGLALPLGKSFSLFEHPDALC